MTVFRNFEVEALQLILRDVFGPEQLAAIIAFDGEAICEYTGCGYFLTVRHPMLPEKRSTLDRPIVMGEAGDVTCGFLVFLGGGELMLECHTWDTVDVPENFRDLEVRVYVVGPQ